MDQNLRDSIAMQQLLATQKLAQQSIESSPKGKQCPYCGGHAIQNYERCKNCSSALSWVEGFPCKQGQESSFAEKLRDTRKKAANAPVRLEQPRMAQKASEFKLILWLALMVSFGYYTFRFGGSPDESVSEGHNPLLTTGIVFLTIVGGGFLYVSRSR